MRVWVGCWVWVWVGGVCGGVELEWLGKFQRARACLRPSAPREDWRRVTTLGDSSPVRSRISLPFLLLDILPSKRRLSNSIWAARSSSNWSFFSLTCMCMYFGGALLSIEAFAFWICGKKGEMGADVVQITVAALGPGGMPRGGEPAQRLHTFRRWDSYAAVSNRRVRI